MSRYAMRACAKCGHIVAHTKSGVPLHMHRFSAKCHRLAKMRRAERRAGRGIGGMCGEPDRHVPKLRCGYPLPCPHHPKKVRVLVVIAPKARRAKKRGVQ